MKRVLVIDDDAGLRAALSEFLKTKGLQVYTAGNAMEAQRWLYQVRFDLILTDLMMPGNGHSVLEYVQDSQPDAVVVVVSSYSSSILAAKVKEDGAYACLSKPVMPEQLEDLLRRTVWH